MSHRLDHLDGLRGVAAVAVVIFHLMSALMPWLVAEQQPGAHWLAYTPFAVLWNGTFAVSVFFVLSGFVVTNATLRKSDPIWIDVVIRYLRLAIPATASTLVAWLLLSLFPTSATDLAALTGSRWLGWTYQETIPGPAAAIYNGMAGIFLTGGSSLIPAIRRIFTSRFGEDRIADGGELTSIAHGLALIGESANLADWSV